MKYMILCCIDEKHWQNTDESVRDEVMRDYGAWVERLERDGHHLESGRLQPSDTARTLRASDGKLSVTDGPFAETKESLGGFHVVECDDMETALDFAKGIPTLRVGGTIEVRAFR